MEISRVPPGARILRAPADDWNETLPNRPELRPLNARERAEAVAAARLEREFRAMEDAEVLQARSRDCYDFSRETPSRSIARPKSGAKSKVMPQDHWVRKGGGNWQRRPHA
jgi:hypothetical protein